MHRRPRSRRSGTVAALSGLALAVLLLMAPPLRAAPVETPPQPAGLSLPQEESSQPLVQVGLDAAGHPRYQGRLTLTAALDLGLRENLSVALGGIESRMAAAETAEAAAMGRPKLSLGAVGAGGTAPMVWSAPPGAEPGFLTVLPPGAVSLNATLMVPVFTGGLLAARLEAAEYSQKAAVARAFLALRQAARAVRTAWHAVQQARAQQEVASWEFQQQQELLRLAHLQLDQGRVARVVVLRAQAEVTAAEGRRELAGAEVAAAEAELKTALGVSVQSDFEYESAPPEPPPQATEEEDLRTALSDRPDLVAARYALEARDRRVAQAVAEFSPQVYAMAMAERMHMGAFQGGPLEGGYQVGLGIAWPLFDGGQRAARLERAQAQKEIGELELERLELEVTAQVVAARARAHAAWRALELAEAEVAAASEGLRIARLRHQAGRSIQLEILDAVAAERRARSTLAEATALAGRARADLLYVTGRF